MSETITTAPRDRLVCSSLPLANRALKAAFAAKRAACQVSCATDEFDMRNDRALPQDARQRAWAIGRREKARIALRDAERALSAVNGPYEALMDQLYETAPAVAETVEATVWGLQP